MWKNFYKYEIYEDGRVWSYKRNKFLKPQLDKGGYQRVLLSDNEGKKKLYQVHRVVWEAVTGNPIPEGLQVNHIDENKKNNSFENLNLLTPKQNNNYGTRTERAAKTMTNGKLSKAVGAFKDGELVMSFPSTMEAERNGYHHSAVIKCCRNCFHREGNNIYKGFEWKYI